MRVQRVAAACALTAALVPGRALACGVSASGVASCSLAEHEEATRPHWALGVSGAYTSTALRFSGSRRAEEVRYATQGSLAYLPTPRWLLQAGLGVTLAGSLELAGQRHDFSPGPLASLGADYRVFDDGGSFVLLTSLLSFSAVRTRFDSQPSVGYEALDLRLGAEAGLVIARVFRPYLLGRVFGGPVFWRYQGGAVTGTDTHHFQLGAGSAFRVSRLFNAFVEGVPLGERAASLGLGIAF